MKEKTFLNFKLVKSKSKNENSNLKKYTRGYLSNVSSSASAGEEQEIVSETLDTHSERETKITETESKFNLGSQSNNDSEENLIIICGVTIG